MNIKDNLVFLGNIIQERNLTPLSVENDHTIITLYNHKINYLNFDPDELDIRDMANAQAKIIRYGGHINFPYTVAQHAVLMSRITKTFGGLMHDTPETYLHDIMKPFKNCIEDVYGKFEKIFEDAIFKKFDVDLAEVDKAPNGVLKTAESLLFVLEESAFRQGKASGFHAMMNHFIPESKSMVWEWDYAEQMFMREFAAWQNIMYVKPDTGNDFGVSTSHC